MSYSQTIQLFTPYIGIYCRIVKQTSRGVLIKRFLKKCSKLTGEHPCRSVISVKLQSNFSEIMLQHGCSPVNLLYIFITPFLKKPSGWLFQFIQIADINMFLKYLNVSKDIFDFKFE